MHALSKEENNASSVASTSSATGPLPLSNCPEMAKDIEGSKGLWLFSY